MQLLISLLIAVVVFAVVIYGLVWVCDKFQVPLPVRWILGAIILIFILVWASQNLGSGSFPSVFHTR